MAKKILTPNTAMGASGPDHSPGFVPDPGGTAGTVRFLCESAAFTQPVASGITNAADVTATNTFTPIQKFLGGLQIGTAPQVATLRWQSTTFLIAAVVGGTVPVVLAFEASGTYAIAGMQSTTAEVAFDLETIVGGNTYQGLSLVESNPANFLSASNTVEFQIAAAKNATPGTVPPSGMAVGDVNIWLKLPVVFQSTTTLAADPTTNLQAATKQYVDGKFTPGFTGTVPLAKLTTGGANGSITVAAGLITAAVNPT